MQNGDRKHCAEKSGKIDRFFQLEDGIKQKDTEIKNLHD
jgi:hypothetical protein